MIIVNIDVMMAKRKISSGELAQKIDMQGAGLPARRHTRIQRGLIQNG